MTGYQVNGCPLCEIFTKNKIVTKVYYPEDNDMSQNNDFVILDCHTCKIPMVVVSDHVTEIGKEQWGRILYQCKKLFGENMTLKMKNRFIKDHFHCHVKTVKC
jgi:hypothetical protein